MGLFRTRRNWAALFCRIAIAAVFIPHGMDKLIRFEPLGWAGPEVWASAVTSLLSTELIPPDYKLILAQVSAWVEVVAGASCVLGLLVRLTVIPLIFDMVIAVVLVHVKNGFWIQHKLDGVAAPGFEYNLVLVLVCLGLLCSGAGSLSLDKLVAGEEHEYEGDVEYEEHHPAHH